MVSKSQLQALLKKKKGAMCAQPPTTAVSEISVSSSSTPASSQFLLPKLERSSSNKTTLAAVKPAPTHVSHPPTTTTTSSNNGLSTLQLKMKDKLAGAQFRWINERLYTTPSESAVAMFGEKPEYFDIYHQGFRNQVKVWPMNPVDVILKDLLKMPVLGWPDSVKEIVVADMGCGEAKLHQVLSSSSSPPTTSTSEEENNIHKDKQKKKRKNTWKIHSFDLVAANDHVVACDIANVPLPAKSCDVVVFCLSLMGTNFLDFIKEANRILKPNGTLKIAEVVSRFQSSTASSSSSSSSSSSKKHASSSEKKSAASNNNTLSQPLQAGVDSFISSLSKLGFKLAKQADTSNKVFVTFEFKKRGDGAGGGGGSGKKRDREQMMQGAHYSDEFAFKPCVYKKR